MSSKKKLLLIDAMALIYRAYFALYKHQRLNSKGLDTSAILGFTNTLVELLTKEVPSHVVVVFDSPGPSFRQTLYPEYKEHREAQPEPITVGLSYITAIVQAFGIPMVAYEGYEADDLIGTLACQAAKEGFEVYLVSSDKDLCQLVDDHIFLYKPSLGKKPAVLWGKQEVLEAWQVDTVGQVVDVLGLWGDTSDNIPGVPNIGEKKAQKLIRTYGSIENLLAKVGELDKGLQQTFTTYGTQALLSKQLAQIVIDAPVRFDAEGAKYEGPDPQVLGRLLDHLEFRSLKKRLLGGSTAADQPPPVQVAEATIAAADPSPLGRTSAYHLINSLQEARDFVKKLTKVDAFCFDIETTELDPLQATIVGMAFSWKKDEAYYLPMLGQAGDQEALLQLLQPIFTQKGQKKVGHNLKYDLSVLSRHEIETEGPYFDTMVAHHLLVPEGRHNLKLLAQEYLHYPIRSIEALIGEKGKGQKSMRDVPLELIAEYACADAASTFELYELFEPRLKQEQLYRLFAEVEMPLIPVLVSMEQAGVRIDKEVLAGISKQLSGKIIQLTKDIHVLAGTTFNLDSPKQLGHVLFEVLKISDTPAKTAKGQYATNEAVLEQLLSKHEIIGKILSYRELKKLQSTYVDALPALISPVDGRLHTSFQQTIVATGRLSSVQPNLQNIPIRTEQGREIRKAFVARSQEYKLLSADYSQIELRIMAHFSGDERMIQTFEAKQDIHIMTAAEIFHVAPEQVTDEMRRQAKMVNFGIIYGISAFGLAQRLGIPRREGAAIIKAYFERFPKVKAYIDKAIASVRERGYAATLLGRKRLFPDINSRNATARGFAERNAVNMPIQGTQAELIKKAMVDIHAWLKGQDSGAVMILQVHDELLFEVPQAELTALREKIPQLMATALPLDVPIEVSCGVGDNWLEAH